MRDATKITGVSSYHDTAVFQADRRDGEIHLADVQFEGTQLRTAVYGGFGERQDRPTTEVADGLRQPQIDPRAFRGFIRLAQEGVPTGKLFLDADHGDCKSVGIGRQDAPGDLALTALGQSQCVCVKNLKAHHRSGSSSTWRR